MFNPDFVFHSYLKEMNKWNTEIDDFKLQEKEGEEEGLSGRIKLKFKRYSMMSYIRET